MAQPLPSTKLLTVWAVLVCLLLCASAQTTIVHSFHTGLTGGATSVSSTSTRASPTVTATRPADWFEDSKDGPACVPEPVRLLDDATCEIRGQADFYGLGVRLGIYFTWLTSWTANNFLPDEMSAAFDTNSIFLLSLVITVLYYSITYKLNAVDALVLLQLAFGFVFSVMSLWGYRTMYYRHEGIDGKRRFGGWGTHCRLLLCGAISIYAVWFWKEGLGEGLPSCAQTRREACGGLKTFMFAKVDVYGPIRWASLAGAVLCCVYYGVQVLAATAAVIDSGINTLRKKKNEWELYAVDITADGLKRNELAISSIILSAFNLLWMLFAACTVEFTLNFNNVTGVLSGEGLISAGQLLPMFIGAFSFIRIMYLVFKEYVLEPHKAKKNAQLRGLAVGGMSGMTAATASPITPTKSKGSMRRGERNFAHRIITAWLPWLSTFPAWRGNNPYSEIMSDGESTPYMSVSTDMEMRRRKVGSTSSQPQREGFVRIENDDTEYYGPGP